MILKKQKEEKKTSFASEIIRELAVQNKIIKGIAIIEAVAIVGLIAFIICKGGILCNI